MYTPMPRLSTDSAHLGARIGDYPGSAFRFFWTIIWAVVAVLCVIGNLGQGSFGGVLTGIALGAGCFAYYYYFGRHPVHAEIYEHGFVIARGGKMTSARWEDVANIEHLVRTWRYYGIIPISRSHTYRITLTNGTRVKVTSAFSKQRELGDTIQRLWAAAAVARRARALVQQQQLQQQQLQQQQQHAAE